MEIKDRNMSSRAIEEINTLYQKESGRKTELIKNSIDYIKAIFGEENFQHHTCAEYLQKISKIKCKFRIFDERDSQIFYLCYEYIFDLSFLIAKVPTSELRNKDVKQRYSTLPLLSPKKHSELLSIIKTYGWEIVPLEYQH